MALNQTHRCDERCVCPTHGTELIYSPSTHEHACQDPNCKYAHGLERILMQRWPFGQ